MFVLFLFVALVDFGWLGLVKLVWLVWLVWMVSCVIFPNIHIVWLYLNR